MDKKMPTILVLGVGNILLKDEGTGVEVAKALLGMELPDNVMVIDGATAGLDLMPYFEEYDYVIIVDIVRAEGEAGAIYKFSPDDVGSTFGSINTSLHQIGILDVWNMAKNLRNKVAKTTIIAIEPEDIDWGIGLTPEIQKKVPELVALVVEEITAINQSNSA